MITQSQAIEWLDAHHLPNPSIKYTNSDGAESLALLLVAFVRNVRERDAGAASSQGPAREETPPLRDRVEQETTIARILQDYNGDNLLRIAVKLFAAGAKSVVAAPQPKTWPQIKAETIEKYEDLFQEQAAKILELESRLAGAAALPSAQNEWISVEDGMPGRSGEYLVVEAGDVEASTADYFIDDKWMTVRTFGQDCEERQLCGVTHWRELPSPPVPSKEPK